MDNILVASGSTAVIISVLMQAAKNSAMIPWLNRNSGRVNLIVSILLAGLTAIGISYSFDFNQDTGAFALGFKGNLTDIAHGILHWIGQWCAQQASYKGLLVPSEALGDIRKQQLTTYEQQEVIKENLVALVKTLSPKGETNGPPKTH